jgi:hypothetical protein
LLTTSSLLPGNSEPTSPTSPLPLVWPLLHGVYEVKEGALSLNSHHWARAGH